MDLSIPKSRETISEVQKKKDPLPPPRQLYLPPCRVCNSEASGFHYGLNTCEACKGFFRRSLARKFPYPVCRYRENCTLEHKNRNICPACRFNKCLKLGMSKLAIRTGRYTVERRTQYTLEIKGNAESSDHTAATTRVCSVSLTSEGISSSVENCSFHTYRSVDKSAKTSTLNDFSPVHSNFIHFPAVGRSPYRSSGSAATTTSDTAAAAAQSITAETVPDRLILISAAPAPTEDEDLVRHLRIVCDAFRDGFLEMVYMFEHCNQMDRVVCKALQVTNLAQPVNIMTISGDSTCTTGDQKLRVNILTTKAEVLNAIDMLHCSISCDMFARPPEYKLTRKELFTTWCINIETFVKCIMRFAMKLPGFNSLPVEDQILVIKDARQNIATLVRFKHFHVKCEVFINYHVASKTMVLLPLQMLRNLSLSKNYYESDRMLRQLDKLNIQMSDLAVLCALTILSPDRAGLTDEGRSTLSRLQDDIIPVLYFALRRSHPKDKSLLAKFLLLLPDLTQLSELSHDTTAQISNSGVADQ